MLTVVLLHLPLAYPVHLISSVFEHSVLCVWEIFVRPIDCNVKHSIFQSMYFPFTQQGMFKCT